MTEPLTPPIAMASAATGRAEGTAGARGGAGRSGLAAAATPPESPDWLARGLDRHALAMVPVLIAAGLAWSVTGGLGPAATVGLLAALVAVLGLPHGAFDMEVGRRLLRPRLGRRWAVPFVGGYLAATAAVAAWWWLHPPTALAGLLVLGVLHFGDEDLGPESRGVHGPRRLMRAGGRGAVAVLAPLALRPDDVAAIFAVLLGGAGGSLADPGVVQTIGLVGLALAVPGLLDAAAARGPRRLPLLEPVAVAAAAWLLPPAAFFTLYFCLVHAVRHSMRSAAELVPADPRGAAVRFVRATWPATAATVLGAGVVAAVLAAGDRPLPAVGLQVVFIGLHALTVPHVLLALLEHRGVPTGDHA